MQAIWIVADWTKSKHTLSEVFNQSKYTAKQKCEAIISPDKRVSNNWKFDSRYLQNSKKRLKRSPNEKYANLDSQLTDSKSTVSECSKAIFMQHLKTRVKSEEIFNTIIKADMWVLMLYLIDNLEHQNQEKEKSKLLMSINF